MTRSSAARRLAAALVLAAATMTAGCITPYRMDVQQGNVITQEMVDQLKPGMTKAQVRFLLGTPLITDPFHPDRWDYFYSLRKGRSETPATRHLTVIFRNDVLVRLEGDIAVRDWALAGETEEKKPAGPNPDSPAAGRPLPEQTNLAPPARRAL